MWHHQQRVSGEAHTHTQAAAEAQAEEQVGQMNLHCAVYLRPSEAPPADHHSAACTPPNAMLRFYRTS